MTAAARKMPIEELAPPNDPRAGLRTAKNLAWRAICALTAHQDAVGRAEDLVASIRAKLIENTQAIEQAGKTDGKAAAKAVSQRDVVGVPSAMREALQHQADLNERLALAESALVELTEETPKKALSVAVTRNAVIVQRNLLLAPIATALLERIRARRVAQLKDRLLLAALLNDDGAPQFPADASAFFAAREAEISRRQAFGAIRAEANADIADLALVPPTHNIEEAEIALQFHHKWTAELAALLENPDAKLPEPD